MKKKSIVQKIFAANQVVLKDWLAMKPYDAPVHNYDVFYLKQCQTVYGYFIDNGFLLQKWELSRPQIKELSCQIVSYFEDYIVEIGIWRTFIETNKELYGYCLPFYDLSEYDETYINVEDIAFLIWHYVTKYSEEELIALLRAEDQNAFSYLYDNYAAALNGIITRMVSEAIVFSLRFE